ncbi:MAG: enoyl-CoA hydratase/isomerase family protein [Actinomycetota bacterium]|nr:enoyl-CoA hydratase/isomerase family protein [Actinomycetota bacterium]
MAEIAVHSRGAVRVAVIDNESTRNAFTSSMAMDLLAILDEAEADPAVRCVVVTGAGGRAFSSGHDLSEVLAHPENASDPVKNAAFVRPTTMTTPVVAAVNGAAYAAGFILALSCDLRVAATNATFGASGARIGLLPVGGQLSRLVALSSYPVAFELTATAAPMTAERAYQVGLVSRVTQPGQALDAALETADTIAANSPAVVRSVKVGLRRTLHDGLDAGLRFEQEQAGALRALPDGAEGVEAFLARRAPVYPDAPVDLPGLSPDSA